MDVIQNLARRRLLAWASLAGAGLALGGCGGGGSDGASLGLQRLQAQARACVQEGLVGVVLGLQEGGLDAPALRAAAGSTRQAGGRAVRIDDRFIIGSNTKAMTAALAARCVEQGLLAWDSRPADRLPGMSRHMHPGYQDLTLAQLLDHRGGLLGFRGDEDLQRFGAFLAAYEGALPDTEPGRRRFFADWLLSQAPVARPGEQYRYSNAGYALAAAMLEAASGQDFKTLFARQLSEPFHLDVRWGAPQGDQPAGHMAPSAQEVQPWPAVSAEVQCWLDVLAPAGAANLAAPAYAQWLLLHQQALKGLDAGLPRSYIGRLQALRLGDYALGWMGGRLGEQGMLVHDGADEGFMSLAAVAQDGAKHAFALNNTFGVGASDGDWVSARLVAALQTLLQPA